LTVGIGYDVHRFAKNRRLVLAGVEVPHHLGLLGHSDADVLTHAIIDALLGAAALGDIGQHFPDTDPRYQGVSSLQLLEQVKCLICDKGFAIINIDATVILQQPKLAPVILKMRNRLAEVLEIGLEQVSIKAKTNEGLGFVGREEGVAALAVSELREL
jgi:2-C-methyl-D-erythritol 2,4-cyclodiphosphate synthase